jgi:C-terminal processing protease CtpA/Prc
MPKVLSSWSLSNDGKLVESDLKLSYSEEDGSYTIEAKHEEIGVVLGLDQITRKYIIITSVPDTKKMAKFKPFVNVGDILVAINDQIIIEESFEKVTAKLLNIV